MKIYVMVDMEGISGIYTREQVTRDGDPGRYQEARQWMAGDVNACVEGLKAGGADQVLVRDCHGSGGNFPFSQLTALAEGYIMGSTADSRLPGIEDCDGLVLLGYHAMAGTAGAVLEHTMSSAGVQNYWINRQKAGEVALDAAVAGDYGKPVILVTGDDKVCAEARALLPDVETACVKQGLTCFGARLLPLERAREEIREKAAKAVKKLPRIAPYQPARPVVIRAEVTERTQLPQRAVKPYMRILDGRTYEVEGSTAEEALFRLY